MRTAFALLAPILAVSLAACATESNAGRAQSAAQELNLNARFGRMELAIEHVEAKQREAFTQRHRAWGGSLRVAEAELAGMKVDEKSGKALVTVHVGWYRMDEQELRTTTVRQTFKDHKGDWLLEAEERVDGDVGLLGEPVVQVHPDDAHDGGDGHDPREGRARAPQFPTVRLGRTEASYTMGSP